MISKHTFHVLWSQNVIYFQNFQPVKVFLCRLQVPVSNMSSCIFCKIISNEAPAHVKYQDKEIIIFNDIKPAAKYHYLSVPVKHISNINSVTTPEDISLCKIFILVVLV